MLTTSVMSNNWSQNSHNLTMNPYYRNSSSQSFQNNLTHHSTQQNAFSMPNIVPTNNPTLSKFVDKVLDETHIEQCLNGGNLFPYDELQDYTGIFGEENFRREYDRWKFQLYRDVWKATGPRKCSLNFRGVTKRSDKRYEAFARDKENGRTVYIGGFSNVIDAARAHDLVSIKIWGLPTLTNFSVKWYWKEIGEMNKMSQSDYIVSIRRQGERMTEVDSPYRGVYSIRAREGKKWEARLGDGSNFICLGTFDSAEDAARAYDIASLRVKGKNAITNFTGYDEKGIMETELSSVTLSSTGQATSEGRQNNEAINPYNTQNAPQIQPGRPLHQQPPSNPHINPSSIGINGNSIGYNTQSGLRLANLPTHIGENIFMNNNSLSMQPLMHDMANGRGATNAVDSFGLLQQPMLINAMQPPNQQYQASHIQSQPQLLNNQSCEHVFNYLQPATPNQNTIQKSSSFSSFSNSVENQNPMFEPNNGSQNHWIGDQHLNTKFNELDGDFEEWWVSMNVDNDEASGSQNPMFEPNNDPQNQWIGGEDDMDTSQDLNTVFMDPDCDFEAWWASMKR